MIPNRLAVVSLAALFLIASDLRAEPARGSFRFFRRGERERRVPDPPADAATVERGHRWKAGRDWAWLLGTLTIPETVDGASVRGKPLGLRVSCASAGEVYLDGAFQCRYDNDKPACAVVSEAAEPGREVRLAIQAQTPLDREEENSLSELEWTLLEPRRVVDVLEIRVDPTRSGDPVPDGIIGLSQGGSMADHDAATARKLREGGFRWFRMDNVLTGCLRREGDRVVEDFADLDRRIDFIHEVGAAPIIAASYMPQPLDAVPDPERHSAPRDYAEWEDLCYRVARRCIERGRRVPFWEVWNEPNTGWLKPGPEDTGSERFEKLYAKALGKPAADRSVVRGFEAYLKLYAATARGVRRADPAAWIGGPALASGPFENSERGHAFNGRGFALGLMLYCEEEKLPLDFVSWHEYFHPPDVFRAEAERFRELIAQVPGIAGQPKSFMVTEWNEAWWADPPQDNELGAAWCAATVVRAFLPARIDRPCLFYAKQGDNTFRGDYGILMAGNVPKPQYHVAAIFNGLGGKWVPVEVGSMKPEDVGGGDDEVCAVAARDEGRGRLAVVLVNFTDRYNVRRKVRVGMRLSATARSRLFLIDGMHSNAYADRERADLECVEERAWPPGDMRCEITLPPHSVSLLELIIEAR